jgi:hypothetical protein
MSAKEAYDFIEAVKNDDQVRKDAQDAVEGTSGKSLSDVGRDHGFHFTPGELNQARHDHGQQHPEDGPDTCLVL